MTYRDRIEAETATGHPALPCPHCGYDDWYVHRPYRKSQHDRPLLFAAECLHCHVVDTAHHAHGNWMGQHSYSRYCGPLTESLYEFVQEHAAFLREAT